MTSDEPITEAANAIARLIDLEIPPECAAGVTAALTDLIERSRAIRSFAIDADHAS
ncbi:hypothetical protein [Sphingomonas sp. M1-B02]|uniref:hypothetical protein n=1 Tax=Sphingomonas sp. M1-B02 TaxID=3114300 RepID=UPI00224014C8|nr:hypothetical protein [Sphingomonas sp. S6-11]UZK66459.1 hypothetical protein OKW87_01050 [Sphingomonas sp. S6-11]